METYDNGLIKASLSVPRGRPPQVILSVWSGEWNDRLGAIVNHVVDPELIRVFRGITVSKQPIKVGGAVVGRKYRIRGMHDVFHSTLRTIDLGSSLARTAFGLLTEAVTTQYASDD